LGTRSGKQFAEELSFGFINHHRSIEPAGLLSLPFKAASQEEYRLPFEGASGQCVGLAKMWCTHPSSRLNVGHAVKV
jgi:hypothetical protein